MKILSFGDSDRGRKRANNEDSFLVSDEFSLYAVADGVGGREGGEIASRVAVETLRETVPDLLGAGDRTPPAGIGAEGDPEAAALRYAVSLANRKIRELSERTPELEGMGTTLTALLFSQGRAFVAHIGDSRAYLLRSGKLAQITRDHSLVAEQMRAGRLTPAQARSSPYRHVITRALGIEPEVETDVEKRPVGRGDVFLLCSDGLTEMVDDREIGRILRKDVPDGVVGKLIAAANGKGGVDNITAVVVKVVEI